MPNGDAAPEPRTVLAWHDALNGGDADRLINLSHPDVEVGGPRGTSRGAGTLRAWVERANISLRPRRLFHADGTVVVEEEAEWRDAESGEVTSSATIGSLFVVRDGRVARVVRYSDLADALQAAGLDETHGAGSGA